MHTRRSTTRTRLLIAVLVVFGCVLAALVVVPGAAIAGDGTSLVQFEENEHDVESGETITLEVVVYDHGDSSGDGLASLSFDVDYDPDVLRVTEVEHGPMLVAGDDVDLVTDSAVDDEGTITVEQERDPAGDGGTGNEVAATVTFEVHDDVGPASTTVDLTNAQAYRTSDWPVYPISRDATIHVDGGAEAEEDDVDDGTPTGVTFADDLEADDESGDQVEDAGDDDAAAPTIDGAGDDEAASAGGEASSSDDTGTDAVPGFGVLGAVAAIVGTLAIWMRGRRP